MKKEFLTFGTRSSSNTNYKNARADHASNRLEQQAIRSDLFDHVYRYDEFKLCEDTDWVDKHLSFVEVNPRGYGYWIWKPYIIAKHIDKLQTGDVLVYADSGCEIIPENYDCLTGFLSAKDFDISISLPSNDGELDPTQDYSNKKYCKSTVLKHFNVLDNKNVLDHEQYQACCQIIYVSDKTKKLVADWLELCSNEHLLNDVVTDHECKHFVDHRHDQAILSLILTLGDFSIDVSVANAIKLNRNRTGVSQWNFPVCDVDQSGYFRAYACGENLYMDSDGGFFAACSVRLHNIVSYINKHKKPPKNVRCERQFNRFRPRQLKYKDLAHDFFNHYDNINIAIPDKKISFAHNHQWRDFPSLSNEYFADIKPVVEKYFSPTREIQDIIDKIECEYDLINKTNNYKSACVLLHRGTDKQKETHIPATQDVIQLAKELSNKHSDMMFIIQSDEIEFLDQSREEFKDKCIIFDNYIRTMKSIPNKSLDLVNDKQTNYTFIKNYLAITNILAKCSYAVIEAGNCGFWMLLYRYHNNGIIQYTRQGKWITNI